MTLARPLAALGISALLLSACAVTQPLTDQEKDVLAQTEVSQYMPASREMRDSIETQEVFAQAAFWSHEYDLNPADLEASIKLAAVVRRLGNPGRAVEITQTSRAVHPRDPYLVAEQGAALIAAERASDAVSVLDEGLRLAPQYARLWSLKGAALDQLEDYASARQHYAQALRITPNDPNILANVGLSHALSGDAATAEQWLRRAVAQPGAGPAVRQNLDLVLQLQGRSPAVSQPQPAPRQVAAPQRVSAPQFQGRQPRARLVQTGPDGQPLRSAADAARAAQQVRPAQGGYPQAQQQAPTPPGDVLSRISRNVGPQRAVPPAHQAAVQQRAMQQPAQPHVVGPALRGAQQGYGYGAAPGYGAPVAGGYSQAQPAEAQRRGAARRRR